jgi:hypothetical protein
LITRDRLLVIFFVLPAIRAEISLTAGHQSFSSLQDTKKKWIFPSSSSCWPRLIMEGCFHLEMAANLLRLLERFLTVFSKCALNSLNNPADFDSAIRR